MNDLALAQAVEREVLKPCKRIDHKSLQRHEIMSPGFSVQVSCDLFMFFLSKLELQLLVNTKS